MEGSGWELHKENIQPLSSGRMISSISILEQSLDPSKSVADHEADIQLQVNELQGRLKNYEGDDPIEPHLTLIRFLEQHCLQNVAWKKLLSSCRMECYKKFYEDNKYRDDPRYVEAIIKCLNEGVTDPQMRLNMILAALTKKEIGRKVGLIYKVVAELQESLGKRNEARQTLKSGIENSAQPVEKLKDALTDLEFRIAGELAKKMTIEPNSTETRNFAASVPVFGEKNDASVFRNDLEKARPVHELKPKPQQHPTTKNVQVFEGELLENKAKSSTYTGQHVGFNSVETALDVSKSNKENKLAPSKWNKPEVVVEHEFQEYEPTRERITIFTDEITEVHTRKTRTVVQEGVLKERKPALTTQELMTLVISETSESEGQQVKDKPVDTIAPLSASVTSSVTMELEPMILQNARLTSKRILLASGKPASFEHFNRDRWLKKKKEEITVNNLTKEKVELEDKLCKVQRELEDIRKVEGNLRENFEHELKQKAVKESQWEQQRIQYNASIFNLTTEVSELKEENQQIKIQAQESIEVKNLLQQELEELKNMVSTQARTIEELTFQLSQQKLQTNTNSSNNPFSDPSIQSPSISNGNESTFIHHQQQKTSMSQSTTMACPTDNLLSTTGMSYMDSYMAPPSRIDLSENENNEELEPSFNASVRMGGATTIFGWRDDKTRFTDFEDSIVSHDSMVPERSMMEMMPPPPPPVSRKLPFDLYESISDSKSFSKKKPDPVLPSKPSAKVESNFKTLSENVAPLPIFQPIVARVTENPITASQKPSNTIGQTFSATSNQNQGQNFNSSYDEDEPPFEPHDPTKSSSLIQPSSELPFDMSNLTCALQFGPPPLLNSTPQREGPHQRSSQLDHLNAGKGNYIHTQRLPKFSDYTSQADGPMSPENEARRQLEIKEWRIERMGRQGGKQNLEQNAMTHIEETSKVSCSSGGTTTSSRGVSVFNLYSRTTGTTSSIVSRSVVQKPN